MTFSNFFDSLGDLDWLAIIVAAVVVLALGWVWYGPLLGKAWSKETGMATNEKPDPMTLAKAFLNFVVLNIGIAYFITAPHALFGNAATFETLVVTSLVLAFFIVGAVMFSGVIWEGQSTKLWAINFGFVFFALAIGAQIQDLMA